MNEKEFEKLQKKVNELDARAFDHQYEVEQIKQSREERQQEVNRRFGDMEQSIPLNSIQLNPFQLLNLKRNIVKPISGIVFGASAATAANYGCFFVADRSYEVISISEEHHVAGADGSAVTITVEKCISGTAPDSGVVLLSTALSLKSTVDTPQFGTLTTTKADLLLKKGDRLVLKDTGVLTAVSDMCVTVQLRER